MSVQVNKKTRITYDPLLAYKIISYTDIDDDSQIDRTLVTRIASEIFGDYETYKTTVTRFLWNRRTAALSDGRPFSDNAVDRYNMNPFWDRADKGMTRHAYFAVVRQVYKEYSVFTRLSSIVMKACNANLKSLSRANEKEGVELPEHTYLWVSRYVDALHYLKIIFQFNNLIHAL